MVASKEALEMAKELCQAFQAGDDKRDAGLPLNIPEVERINNLAYGEDLEWQILDIYRPKNYEGKLPIIINMHGGGWVYGSKETYQFYGMELAKEGFAFVNISYRLPPQVEFPQELDDLNQAIHWLAKQAQIYDLDTNNAFIVGDSAGGQMALQYLTILSNPDFRKLFGYDLPSLQVRAGAINCGGTFLNRPHATDGAPSAYFTEDALEKYGHLLETEKYMTQEIAPLFIMTSSDDFLRDDSVRLDGYLLAKGFEHEFHSYGSPDNPKGHVFHCNIKDKTAKQCNQDQINFFRKYMV